MGPKWHHVALEKAPSLRMESVQEIFTRAATPRGEISARETDSGPAGQILIQLLQLLFTGPSSVYAIFAVWFGQIDCCGR